MYLPFYLFSLCLVPFNGILVRYRLAYYPAQGAFQRQDDTATKPLTQGNSSKDDDATANKAPSHESTADGPVSTEQKVHSDTESTPSHLPVTESANVTDKPTFFGIAKRVRQKEGYAGLFKGLVPTMIVNIFIPFFSHGGMPRLYISPSPAIVDQSLERDLFRAIFYTIALTWVYRAIATRARLKVFGGSVKDGMKTLFSHYECEKPWRIYSFGLLSVLVVNISLRILVLRPLNSMAGPDNWDSTDSPNYPLRIFVFVLLVLANTLVLAPFDVVTTRLAVQRNEGGTRTAESLVEPSAQPVDVDIESASSPQSCFDYDAKGIAVRFRPDSDLEPYKNAYDCVKQITREEGWGVLYRGWFFAFLGAIFSGQIY